VKKGKALKIDAQQEILVVSINYTVALEDANYLEHIV